MYFNTFMEGLINDLKYWIVEHDSTILKLVVVPQPGILLQSVIFLQNREKSCTFKTIYCVGMSKQT